MSRLSEIEDGIIRVLAGGVDATETSLPKLCDERLQGEQPLRNTSEDEYRRAYRCLMDRRFVRVLDLKECARLERRAKRERIPQCFEFALRPGLIDLTNRGYAYRLQREASLTKGKRDLHGYRFFDEQHVFEIYGSTPQTCWRVANDYWSVNKGSIVITGCGAMEKIRRWRLNRFETVPRGYRLRVKYASVRPDTVASVPNGTNWTGQE
jgi:hypothetical protein